MSQYAPVATSLLRAGDKVRSATGETGVIKSVGEPEQGLMFHPLFGPIPVTGYRIVLHNETTGLDEEGMAPAEDEWQVKISVDDEDVAREFGA
jgi:hypothetical protein